MHLTQLAYDLAMTLIVLTGCGFLASLGALPAFVRDHYAMKKDAVERAPFPLIPIAEDPPSQHHSETSTAAAAKIKPSAGSYREQVFACLKEHGPQTDEMLQDRLQMNPSTQRPRRIELWQAGRIKEAGYSLPTRSGRLATVWKIVEAEDA